MTGKGHSYVGGQPVNKKALNSDFEIGARRVARDLGY